VTLFAKEPRARIVYLELREKNDWGKNIDRRDRLYYCSVEYGREVVYKPVRPPEVPVRSATTVH
jgi:hypothetical protein